MTRTAIGLPGWPGAAAEPARLRSSRRPAGASGLVAGALLSWARCVLRPARSVYALPFGHF